MSEFIGKYELKLTIDLHKTRFVVYANNQDNEIHMFDLDLMGMRSLTNSMDVEFCNDVMRDLPYEFKQRFTNSMADIKFYWVGTDGVACQYDYATEGISFVEPKEYRKLIPITLYKFVWGDVQ